MQAPGTAKRAIRNLSEAGKLASPQHSLAGVVRRSPVGAGGRKMFAPGWMIAAVLVVLVIAGPPLARVLFQRQLLVDELQRTKEECRRADDNLLMALATIGDQFNRSGIEGRLLPKEELAFCKSIYDEANNQPAERFAAAIARRRAGVAHLKLRETDEARLCFTLAIHIFETLGDACDSDMQRKTETALAETHSDFASYFAQIGDFAAANEQYQTALATTSKLIETRPDCDDGHSTEADVRQARAATDCAHHRFPRAEDDLNRVLVIQQKRIFGQNIWRHWLGSPGCKLIAARIQLCDLYESTNRVPSEIAALRQTLDALKLFDDYKTDIHYRTQQADALDKLAAAYAIAGNQSRSDEVSRAATAAFVTLALEYPEVVSYKQKLAQLKSEEKSTARPNAPKSSTFDR